MVASFQLDTISCMNYYILKRKADVMRETIKAIYENGVIKPLKKLRIKDHETLTVTISNKAPKTKRKKPAMSMVGIFDSGMKDLSKDHDKHLYGWKKTSK